MDAGHVDLVHSGGIANRDRCICRGNHDTRWDHQQRLPHILQRERLRGLCRFGCAGASLFHHHRAILPIHFHFTLHRERFPLRVAHQIDNRSDFAASICDVADARLQFDYVPRGRAEECRDLRTHSCTGLCTGDPIRVPAASTTAEYDQIYVRSQHFRLAFCLVSYFGSSTLLVLQLLV